jgi:hypothetical protein
MKSLSSHSQRKDKKDYKDPPFPELQKQRACTTVPVPGTTGINYYLQYRYQVAVLTTTISFEFEDESSFF